jgi:hypothetical protein
MRAITIDDDLLEYDAPVCGVFKELYRQEVFEDDELPNIIILHPATYQEVPNEVGLDPNMVYLLVVITDTLIHEAVEKNYIKLAEYLIGYGYCDVNATDDDERTPLSYCTDPDLATLLIQAGAEVNHTDLEENTCMHHLLTSLVEEMTKLSNIDKIHSIVRTLHVLSWNGADPDMSNDDDVTCREMYHAVFPEENVNDEDPDLREFFASRDATSSSYSYSSSSALGDMEM